MRPIALFLPVLLLPGCGERGVAVTNASIEEVAQQASGTTRQRAGQWETTARIVSVDMPKAAPMLKKMLNEEIGQPRTISNCVPASVADRPGFGIVAPLEGAKCRFVSFSMNGGKLDSVKNCTAGGATIKIRNWGSYAAESYDMQQSVSRGGATPSAMTIRLTGKRTGDCKPGAADATTKGKAT